MQPRYLAPCRQRNEHKPGDPAPETGRYEEPNFLLASHGLARPIDDGDRMADAAVRRLPCRVTDAVGMFGSARVDIEWRGPRIS